MRKCKYGIDPLYLDNGRSANVANFTIEMWTLAPAATTAAQAYNAVASSNVYIEGNFSIVHTDTFGETWQTTPLDIHSTCADIISALEALPNDVFNGGVTCYRSTFTRGYLKQTSGTWMTINGQEPPINGGGVTQNPIVDNGRYVYEKWTLVFNNNPGYTNSLSINKYLDGDRPTLYPVNDNNMFIGIYANGWQGEDVDLVPDRCEGVVLGLQNTGNYVKLTGLTPAESKLLKACLGDSNGDNSDNVEVYNWDYGTVLNPHVIFLRDLTGYSSHGYDTSASATLETSDSSDPSDIIYPSNRICDKIDGLYGSDPARYGNLCADKNPAGFYALMYYVASADEFRIFHNVALNYGTQTKFSVYTTDNWIINTNPNVGAYTTRGDKVLRNAAMTDFAPFVHTTNVTSQVVNNLACEDVSPLDASKGYHACLNKGDRVFMAHMPQYLSSGVNKATATAFASAALSCNPAYMNLYEVERIWREFPTLANYQTDTANPLGIDTQHKILLNVGVNARFNFDRDEAGNDESTVASSIGSTVDCTAYVYKWMYNTTKYTNSGYDYAGQCSNRGLCNYETGVCDCFTGYTNDNCDTQNVLAQ